MREGSSTMAEISISIEIKYFGSDCSILLEFSQFLDICIFFQKHVFFLLSVHVNVSDQHKSQKVLFNYFLFFSNSAFSGLSAINTYKMIEMDLKRPCFIIFLIAQLSR